MEHSVKTATFDDDDVYVFPASFAQQRLWFLNQLDPASSFYNVPTVLRLEGRLNIEVLRRALAELVRRHESLRTTFAMVDGEPVQVIGPPGPVDFIFLDNRSFASEAEALGRLNAEAQRPFDLENGPLLRVVVAQLSAEVYLALLNLHHIISDGWSKSVLVRDLSVLYEDFLQGRAASLAELAIQYADYSQWQREWLRGEVLEEQLAYWREQLGNIAPVLQLPTDRPRAAVQTYNGAVLPYHLEPRVVSKLQALSKGENATLFMLLMAAFKALLYRHSGQSDIVVGTPVAGRPRAELEGLIGFFVNTLALRTTVTGDESFRSLLRRVRQGALGAYAHQDVPFEKLVEDLQPERNLSFTPLFQVVFALQNASTATLQLSGLRWSLEPLQSTTAKFDLTFLLAEEQGQLSGSLEYNTDLFDRGTVKRLLQHFSMLLDQVAANPDVKIADIPLLSDDERRLLLTQWQGTSTAYPRTRCVQQLFEEQVARSPEAVALVAGEQRLSYGELNRRANQLAHQLRKLGVGPEVRVGICLERSVELIVALLGILKAGGAYVPLDAGYPKERLAYMLREAKPRVLLTDRKTVAALPVEETTSTLLLEQWQQELTSESSANPRCETRATNLAYVMYTSGSTGRPKGVSVSHRSIVRLVRDTNYLEFSSGDVFLQFAPISFDASTLEIWGGLLNGGSVVVLPGDTPSLAELGSALQQHGVTTLWLTAGLFHLLVDEQLASLSGVKQLLAGGDVLSPAHVQRVLRAHAQCRVINGYGPTENTTFTCCHRMTEGNSPGATVPIGRPIANTTVYLVDERVRAVPVGVVGELVTGGDGLARGYYNCPELTAAQFIPDPFSVTPGGRLYRTGDLARYLADGSIEFVGRVDQQVKLRGFRVELGEIEFKLNQYPGVDQSVVVVRSQGPVDKELVAYIVGDSSRIRVDELRQYLTETLPEFMLPAHFVLLDELPLTPNGKIDRRALPDITTEQRGKQEPPQTPLEELLVGIWGEVLGLAEIGRRDNFFELGGHSLSATRVVSRVRAVTGQAVALRELFEAATVAQLAARLERRQSGEVAEEPALERRAEGKGPAPLSSAQQRLWFIDQLEPGSAAYNIPAAVRLRGPLDREALAGAFTELVRRQEALRTIFPVVAGEPVQVVQAATAWSLPVVEMSGRPEAEREQELAELAAREAERGFDLAQGPLMRSTLVQLGEQEHVLLLVIHHIITDGWSLGLLVRELSTHYEQLCGSGSGPLPELALQYGDYAEWQRSWLKTEKLQAQLQYWRETLAGAPPLLELPLDRGRGAVLSYRGGAVSVALGAELSRELKEVARREGATLFMVLLAAFKTLLFRYTGQTDLVVGTAEAGRVRAELEPIIGLFVNTLALRTRLSGEQSFGELLRLVRETALNAYAHQELPFDTLVEHLQPDRSLSHHPLFQVMFVVQNTPAYTISVPGLTFSAEPFSKSAAQFDLVISITEANREFVIAAQYSTDLFDELTIKNLLEHLRTLLASVVTNTENRLADLPLITDDEQAFLTKQLNDTRAPYPEQTSIQELFEDQVKLTPDSVALIDEEGRQLSYGELNRRSNQLAHHLTSLGVGPESLVCVLMDRSLESTISLLGILKAGGAYVPLDASYPKDRLAYMLSDSGAGIVITKSGFVDSLPEHVAHVIKIDDDWIAISQHSTGNLPLRSQPQHPAYVIYTSGSTGQPKGVLGLHRGAVNRFHWMWTTYPFAAGEVCCQKTSLSFVDAVWEVFGPLLQGVPTIIFSDDAVKDTDRFIDSLAYHGVTRIVLVPSLLRVMLDAAEIGVRLAKLKYCVCSGEALPAELAQLFQQRLPHCTLLNLYGSSEVSADATSQEVAREWIGTTVAIGRPLANVQVYVLDEQLRPLPIGARGELYVGGDALARGYLRRPDLTADRFIPDAFGGRAGARLYRTGDVARRLVDGTVEYLGRADHQVKVRGYRIELEEIESVLKRHQAVREAVVHAHEDATAGLRLAAYIVAEQPDERTINLLREHLRERLPDHMMPAAFVLLDTLPLTPNGKVDRHALPVPQKTADVENSFQPPRNATEQEIVDLWSELLGVERVGIEDNFFELGGHSLLATQMISRVRMNFGVELDVKKFFLRPTIATLAELVEQNLFAAANPAKLAGLLGAIDDLGEEEAQRLALGVNANTAEIGR